MSEFKIKTSEGRSERSDDRSEGKSAREGRDEGGRDSYRRRRPRPPVDLIFDYKDIDSLRQFLSDGGKIVPARVSRLSRKQQRVLTTEVKRARQLALLPFSDRHESI